MAKDELNVLSAFLAVAEERSFTRAARRLAVSPSALSHAIRGLEERLGVRLLARTTRSVAPTGAGDQLLARLGPALGDIRGALEQVTTLRERPAGRVRLLASPLAATMILGPKLGKFVRDYPDIELEVTTTNEGRFDLVAGRFDAGIHLGEFIERDMIAVRVSADQRAAIVASPRYFERQVRPVSPKELTQHRCLNFRYESSGVYRWEFEKGRKKLAVAVDGPLIVDDAAILIDAAVAGAGVAYLLESQVTAQLASGALVRMLEDWCPPFAGYFLYYPSRRQQPAALAALTDALRLGRRASGREA